MAGMPFLFLSLFLLSEELVIPQGWEKATFHRLEVVDEGHFNPEDWVLIYKIPKWSKHKIQAREEFKPVLKMLSVSVQPHDRGQVLKDEQWVKVIFGWRNRWAISTHLKDLKIEDLKEHFPLVYQK